MALISLLYLSALQASGAAAENATNESGSGGPRVLTASIYDQHAEPPKLLFRFRRTAHRSGSTLNVLREYSYPDGKLAAREQVQYENGALKRSVWDDLQTGEFGSATLAPDAKSTGRTQIEFEYRAPGAAPRDTQRASEVARGNLVVNDMLGVFLSTNFMRLQTGAAVRCRYLVIPRLETIGFTFRKQRDIIWAGHSAVILKMEPTSLLIAALVDPLYFIVEQAAPHRVLQYTGRTTPKVRDNQRWKDLDARTVFDWK